MFKKLRKWAFGGDYRICYEAGIYPYRVEYNHGFPYGWMAEDFFDTEEGARRFVEDATKNNRIIAVFEVGD